MHALHTVQLNSKIAQSVSLSKTSSNRPLLPLNLRFRNCTEKTRTFLETASSSFTFLHSGIFGLYSSFCAILDFVKSKGCEEPHLFRLFDSYR